MKVYKLELVGFDGTEDRREMYQLSCDCQQIINRIWQLWEAWHVANGSRKKLIEHFERDRKWRETKDGARPKWPVDCIPKLPGKKNSKDKPLSLRSQIEADISQTFPHVHSRIRTLLANITFKKINTAKASKGSLKGWMAILLNYQSRPSATRPQPIPFDKQHSKVIPATVQSEDASLFIRLHRDASKSRAISEYQEFRLRTTGRASRYVKPIVRMASGEWGFKGSSLLYDSSKKKWFALLVCELPKAESVEAVEGSVAMLRMGYAHPIQLRINGERRFMRNFGAGLIVETTRRQLLTQRWSRQQNYRVAGHSNKGHGLNRAIGPVFLLSKRWKDFVKRYNHTMTSALVEMCLKKGISKLIYFQPTTGRFLSEAGKMPGANDPTGWDFFQIGAMLKYKCERHGINCVVRKSGKSSGASTSIETVA